jgi:hypothetical protein
VLLCTVLDHVQVELRAIGGLDLVVDAAELLLQLVLGAGVDHLRPHPRGVRGPRDEEDLTLLAADDAVRGRELEVVHAVPALVLRQRRDELLVARAGAAQLLHRDLLRLLVQLEHDEPERLPPLQLQELELALLAHRHTRRHARHGSPDLSPQPNLLAKACCKAPDTKSGKL